MRTAAYTVSRTDPRRPRAVHPLLVGGGLVDLVEVVEADEPRWVGKHPKHLDREVFLLVPGQELVTLAYARMRI